PSTLFPYTTLFRSEPASPDVARHDGERTLERDQPWGGGGREGVVIGSLRPVARLPSLQPGRIFGDGGWLCRALPDRASAREDAPGGAGMGDHAGGALGTRRLAIRPGPRRPTWGQA